MLAMGLDSSRSKISFLNRFIKEAQMHHHGEQECLCWNLRESSRSDKKANRLTYSRLCIDGLLTTIEALVVMSGRYMIYIYS